MTQITGLKYPRISLDHIEANYTALGLFEYSGNGIDRIPAPDDLIIKISPKQYVYLVHKNNKPTKPYSPIEKQLRTAMIKLDNITEGDSKLYSYDLEVVDCKHIVRSLSLVFYY